MIKKLQKKYALSEQGAKDLIKGCLACVLQNLSFMFPVGLLYFLTADLMNGGIPDGKAGFYIAGCAVCIGLIRLPHISSTTPHILQLILKAACGGSPLLNICEKSPCHSSGKRIWQI